MKHYLNKKQAISAAVLVLLTIAARLLFAERNLYDIDTVGFALGSISYSLELTRPHMPGYFLHIQIISLLNYITANPHLSMLILSLIYSSLGTLFAYLLLLKFLDEKNSFLIALLLATNPLVWYYGSSTHIYIFDLLFSALFVLLGTSKKWIYLLPLFTAVAMGIRPSSGVFLFPLYCYMWYSYSKSNGLNIRYFMLAHIGAIAGGLMWFLPMALSTGSLLNYFKLFNTNSSMPNTSIPQNIFQFTSYLLWFVFPLALTIIYLVVTGKAKQSFKIVKEFYMNNRFLLYWIIPLAAVFIFYHYAKGWMIIAALPLIIWIGILSEKKMISKAYLFILIVMQIAVFALFPKMENKVEDLMIPQYRNRNIFTLWYTRTFSDYSMTYSKINEQDRIISEFDNVVNAIKKMPDIKSNVIYLDPLIYSYARSLQYIYPQYRFITLDYYRPDGFIEFSNDTIERKAGLKNILSDAILVTGPHFYRDYLKIEGGNTTSPDSDFVYLLISPEDADEVSSLYYKYFVRTRQ